MSAVAIKRVIRAGFLDFWRNGFVSFTSILVMTVTLFVLGTTIFAGVILNTTLEQLHDKTDINVYFTTTAPPDKIAEFQKTIAALPQVQEVTLLTADQVLASFRTQHQNNQLILQALDELGQNPLSAVLNVRAKDITQYDAIGQFLKQQQDLATGDQNIIASVNYFDVQYRAAVDRLQHITQSAKQVGLVIIILLILTTLAISFNTFRLIIYVSREEIQVMRLVGAGQMYIRAPFMVEGALYGLISGLVTLLLFYPLTYYLGQSTETFFGGVNVFTYYISHFPFFFAVIVGTGVLLSVVASFLAVRRYLKI